MKECYLSDFQDITKIKANGANFEFVFKYQKIKMFTF